MIYKFQSEKTPRISIVTATFNSSQTISDCLRSVNSQTYPVEHIIVDGASTDNTVDIVLRDSPNAHILSEPDEGIYDAMNKGIMISTGDVIGILNSDDFYEGPLVLEKVAALFGTCPIDALFADLVYVNSNNLNRVVRYYSGSGFTPDKFAFGCMPPHPTFFVRKSLYERFGFFLTDYKIAADFELAARFLLRHRVPYTYLPEVIVRMRTGGASTRNLKSNWILNREILRACISNGIATNYLKIYSKYFTKIFQILKRPSSKITI